MTLLTRYKQWTHAVVQMVNAPRGDAAHYRSRYLLPQRTRQDMQAAGVHAVAHGLAHATTGEISVRLRATQLAITCQGANLTCLGESDVLIGGLASATALPHAARHLDWHHAIYQHTPATSVVVVQPTNVLALAMLGRLPEEGCSDVLMAIGGVQLIHAHEVLAAVAERAAHTHVFVVQGVGCIAWGDSPHDALLRADALEYAARLTIVTHMLRSPSV